MEKYVRPEMEIDFVEDCELITTSDPGGCGIPGCPINYAYGDGEEPDPFG